MAEIGIYWYSGHPLNSFIFIHKAPASFELFDISQVRKMLHVISCCVIGNIVLSFDLSNGEVSVRFFEQVLKYVSLPEVQTRRSFNDLHRFVLFLLFEANVLFKVLQCFLYCREVVVYEVGKIVIIGFSIQIGQGIFCLGVQQYP